MKNTIEHYHFTLNGKNILCAIDFENHIRQYDVTIWCDNRIIGREKMKSISRMQLNRIVKDRLYSEPEKTKNNIPVSA
jgi:hypothetical protein